MIGERINGSTAGRLRRRLLRHQLDWSPWLDRGLRPTSDRHVRMRAFININSDLYQDHAGVIHEAWGLNVNIALRRPCCFFGQQTCIRRHRLLECRLNDYFGGIMRNYVYNNPAEISSSSDGGISGNLRYTGALLNLDENPDEFGAGCPASSSDVLWKTQLLIGCGIPISITCQKFTSIRPSKLREPSD